MELISKLKNKADQTETTEEAQELIEQDKIKFLWLGVR